MGCTSSAPKMPTPRANSEAHLRGYNPTEEAGTLKNNEMDAKKDTETNMANVLPNMCDNDNLVDHTELDRNNKSLMDTPNPDKKDLQSSGQETSDKMSVDNKNNVVKNSTEEKLSTLEEVVEKVVELYVADSGIESLNAVSSLTDYSYLTDDSGANKLKNSTEHQIDEAEPIETKEADPAGVVSPSPSQDSRATRWEALADVAAELPPSLAVDPLTGQIYALSK